MENQIHEYYTLDTSCCIVVKGVDARKILNNLTTNDIAKLPEGSACETFITNLKGWGVAHGIAAIQKDSKDVDLLTFVGVHSNPDEVAQHIDRYIIREDAKVMNLSSEQSVAVLYGSGLGEHLTLASSEISFFNANFAGSSALLFGASDLVQEKLRTLRHGVELKYEQYTERRIRSGWPEQGKELTEKSIPQELDRDEKAISFTKGCYLGQETIARLDARGQLQRKLSILEITGSKVDVVAGTKLFADEKEVGIISSLAHSEDKIVALATLRRGHFQVGSQLQVEKFDSNSVIATVVEATH